MKDCRRQIILDYAKWTALSALRSGTPAGFKARKDVYPQLDKIAFSDVLLSHRAISASEFNAWHERETEALCARVPINTTIRPPSTESLLSVDSRRSHRCSTPPVWISRRAPAPRPSARSLSCATRKASTLPSRCLQSRTIRKATATTKFVFDTPFSPMVRIASRTSARSEYGHVATRR